VPRRLRAGWQRNIWYGRANCPTPAMSACAATHCARRSWMSPQSTCRRHRSIPGGGSSVETDEGVACEALPYLPVRCGRHVGYETGGERGIRTLEGLLTLTPLAGVRLRPLGHLSTDGNSQLVQRVTGWPSPPWRGLGAMILARTTQVKEPPRNP
jgi:hypothetical protein